MRNMTQSYVLCQCCEVDACRHCVKSLQSHFNGHAWHQLVHLEAVNAITFALATDLYELQPAKQVVCLNISTLKRFQRIRPLCMMDAETH